MAREVIVRMTDDIDRGQEADTTEEFTFENVTYVLDLTTKHSEDLRADLKKWMDAAHERIKLKRNSPSIVNRAPDGETKEARERIRSWAVKHGLKVSDRGVVSKEVRDAYSAAHGTDNDVIPPPPSAAERHSVGGRRVPWNALPEDVPNSNGISRHMRNWAKENGYPVKPGGYVAADVRAAYHAAMGHDPDMQLDLNGAEHA